MRHVKLFQVLDVFCWQCDIDGADGIIDMRNRRWPDNRSRDLRLLQQPRQRHMRAGDTKALRNIPDAR